MVGSFGVIFCALFIIEAIFWPITISTNLDSDEDKFAAALALTITFMLVWVALGIYWTICIYSLWEELREQEDLQEDTMTSREEGGGP